jgi:DNA-binding NtrC family response regulator
VGRNETILLVEDDVAVLRVTERFLRGQGYTVIATDRPLAAEGLLAEAQGGVDLLLTDVLMPALNGRKLWDRLKQTKPGLRALFMSGHTDDVLGAQGILEPGIHFLQKPFSLDGLATKVREALDALDVSAAPRA